MFSCHTDVSRHAFKYISSEEPRFAGDSVKSETSPLEADSSEW